MQDLGAGEILLTSKDRDGTKDGYDIPVTKAIAEAVDIPVIASGGVGTMDHIYDAFVSGADACLAASIFHYETYTVGEIKASHRPADMQNVFRRCSGFNTLYTFCGGGNMRDFMLNGLEIDMPPNNSA